MCIGKQNSIHCVTDQAVLSAATAYIYMCFLLFSCFELSTRIYISSQVRLKRMECGWFQTNNEAIQQEPPKLI